MAGRQWIYRYVRADREAGGRPYLCLRRRDKKPNRKGGWHASRGHIPGRVDISEPRAVVEAKERVGDREADTIIGKCHSCTVVSLVEHASKYVLLERVGRKTVALVGTALPSMPLPRCAPGPHDHGGQRQGVRRPCLGGEGAGRRVLACGSVAFPGARTERAYLRPGPGVLPEGDRLPPDHRRPGHGSPGPSQCASGKGAWLQDPGRDVPPVPSSLTDTVCDCPSQEPARGRPRERSRSAEIHSGRAFHAPARPCSRRRSRTTLKSGGISATSPRHRTTSSARATPSVLTWPGGALRTRGGGVLHFKSERVCCVGAEGRPEDAGRPERGPLGGGERIVLTRVPEIAPGVEVRAP